MTMRKWILCVCFSILMGAGVNYWLHSSVEPVVNSPIVKSVTSPPDALSFSDDVIYPAPVKQLQKLVGASLKEVDDYAWSTEMTITTSLEPAGETPESTTKLRERIATLRKIVNANVQ